MKRNLIKPLEYPITTIYPLFKWKLCIGCNKEVCREPMWHYEEIFINGHESRNWYGCKDCFKTKQDFINTIDDIKQKEAASFIPPSSGSSSI